MMSSFCYDDSIRDAFKDILQKLDFPLLLEILGVIFTAIIQSSSAMTGIVIVMVGNQAMTLRNGLFITLGANVGTCVTALLGIIGANTNSKRTALIHFIFNMSGCLIFTPLLWIFADSIISILEKISDEDSMRIAYFHLFFNITTAIITTPLIKYLVKLVCFLIKDKEPPLEYIEWFIKDKDDKNALMEPQRSSKSINISETNDNFSEDIISNKLGHKDNIIIKDDIGIKDAIFRKDSSEISDKENEDFRKNSSNSNNNEENLDEKDGNIANEIIIDKKIEEEEKDKLNNDD